MAVTAIVGDKGERRELLFKGRDWMLQRTMFSAAFYIFFVCFVLSIVYTPYATLLLHRQCTKRGIADNCKPGVDGYAEADQAVSSEQALLEILSGIAQLLTCKLLGDIGDSLGRRAVLMSPCIYLIVNNLGLALLPATSFIFIFGQLSFVASLFGGGYVASHVAFATVADVTQGCSPATRSLCFSIVEAFLWAGLLSGPFVSGSLIDLLGAQNVFFVAAGGGFLNLVVTYFSFHETLEPERRRPFRLARANPCATLPMVMHSRSTFFMALAFLFAQFTANGGVSLIILDALNFTDSSELLGYLVAVNNGMQCFGLVVIMPVLMKFLSLRQILLFSLFMGFVSWNCYAIVTDEWQMLVCSLLTPANAAFFPVVRTGMANTFGAQKYGESLAVVGVLQQIASTSGAVVLSKVFSFTNHEIMLTSGFGIRCVAFTVAGVCAFFGFLAALGTGNIPSESSEESQSNVCRSSISNLAEKLVQTVPEA